MYTAALPILTEFEYQGTFFLHTNNIDTAGGLAKEMIQEMVASGMEIGSHTLSHPDLTKISTTRLQQELIDSKNILSEITGCSIQTFEMCIRDSLITFPNNSHLFYFDTGIGFP